MLLWLFLGCKVKTYLLVWLFRYLELFTQLLLLPTLFSLRYQIHFDYFFTQKQEDYQDFIEAPLANTLAD